FKLQLQGMATVRSVTASNALPSKGYDSYYNNMSVAGITRPKAVEGRINGTGEARVDVDFVPTFGLRLVAGRNFSKDLASDRNSVILNEAAAKQLGFTDPSKAPGHVLQNHNQHWPIIGVLKNYHHDYLKQDYTPAIYRLDPSHTRYFSVKIAAGADPAGRIRETLAAVEKEWKAVYPGNPFEYFFLDDAFNEQYRADQQLAATTGLFAFLAIGVACLGLFGLVSFATAQRTKEVGIRKVLGARTGQLLFLLSKDFLGLILAANLIAWPLTYWGTRKWLDNYAFKIPVTPVLFVLPTLAVLGIAVLTIVLHVRKAARRNPVESLRYE
ncbi:MAG TPA: FtsX-like permease family protein, partial [Cytophagales bacterium]